MMRDGGTPVVQISSAIVQVPSPLPDQTATTVSLLEEAKRQNDASLKLVEQAQRQNDVTANLLKEAQRQNELSQTPILCSI